MKKIGGEGRKQSKKRAKTKSKLAAIQEHRQHEHRQCGVDIVEAVDVEGYSLLMTKGVFKSVWVCWD